MDPKNIPTIKDNQVPNIQSDTRKLAIFQNDSDFYVVHKKAEKLAVATYMISNFFTAEEPLKWSLRKVSTELLKDTISLSSASLSLKDSLVRSLVAKLVELKSLYEIAYKAGFISSMNFTIITEELEKILELLDKREGSQVNTKSISFDESFFRVEKPQGDRSMSNESGAMSGQELGVRSFESRELKTNSPHLKNTNINSHPYKVALSFIKDNNILKDIKDKRQNIIIALVKKHRTLTIKGFTGVIKDCSEKTIQRELLSLVAKGILKKDGERRWSTYSLA
jgi:hypothetical protein